MNPNINKANKKKLIWLLPSIAIVAMLVLFTVPHIMAGDIQDNFPQTNAVGQIDPMDMVREVFAADKPRCAIVPCDYCIEVKAMFQEQFQEWHLPHNAYLEDFDYMVAVLAANVPAFYVVAPYVDNARMILEELAHVNNWIFYFLLMVELGPSFLYDLNIPMWPLPIAQYEERHGDFINFLLRNGIDTDFFVLPNSNMAVFIPSCC